MEKTHFFIIYIFFVAKTYFYATKIPFLVKHIFKLRKLLYGFLQQNITILRLICQFE